VTTATIDQRRHAVATQFAQRRVCREATRASRPFRVPVKLISRFLSVRQVRGAVRHCRSVRRRVRYKGIATVERDVEPFVAIGRPRISFRQALRQATVMRAGRSPHPERAIHVNPGPVTPGEGNQLLEWIECAEVDVAGLEQRYCGNRRIAPQRRFQRLGPKTAMSVSGQIAYIGGAEAEQSHGALEGAMPLTARQNPNTRRAVETLLFDIPAALCQKRMARRGQTCHMRHLTSAHQREAGVRRQPEQFLEPVPGNFLDHRRRRPTGVQRGVLIPD
jgi:hypothetical protein